jgi:hypothetical protein
MILSRKLLAYATPGAESPQTGHLGDLSSEIEQMPPNRFLSYSPISQLSSLL